MRQECVKRPTPREAALACEWLQYSETVTAGLLPLLCRLPMLVICHQLLQLQVCGSCLRKFQARSLCDARMLPHATRILAGLHMTCVAHE